MEELFFNNDPYEETITVPEFFLGLPEEMRDIKSILEGLVKLDELLDRKRISNIMFQLFMKIYFSGKKRRFEVNKDGEAREIQELTVHEMHNAPQLHVPPMHVPPMHVPPMQISPMHVPAIHVPPVYFPPGFSP
jgi:hypothetical protein